MTAAKEVTKGAVLAFHSDNPCKDPVLQVLNVKPSENGRFRMVLSDGSNIAQAIVQPSLAPVVQQIEKWALVQVTRHQFILQKNSNRKVLVLSGLEVVSGPVPKIGNPVLPEGSNQDPDLQSQVPNQNVEPIKPEQKPQIQAKSSPAPLHQQRSPQKQPFKPSDQNQNQHQNTYQGLHSLAPPPQTSINPNPDSVFGSEVNAYPIALLNPYQQKWVIKARVTVKTPMKEWKNQKGEGKLFSVDLLDQSGEIRATAFNEAVDKFFNLLEVGKSYYISRCQLKTANKQYSSLNNPYEMQLDVHTEIALCTNDSGEIPKPSFRFIKIGEIERLQPNNTIDIIGVVTEIGETQTVGTKNGDSLRKTITILDDSGASIKLTLWGSFVEMIDQNIEYPICAFKAVRIADFNGRSLSTLTGTTLLVNPDLPETARLRNWFEMNAGKTSIKSLSNQIVLKVPTFDKLITIAQMRDSGLGQTLGQPDDCFIKALVVNIPHDGTISYPACPTENCNKKVNDDGPNSYRCDKCNQTFNACEYRYTLSISLVDFTGQAWFRTFDSVGLRLLDAKADVAHQLKMTDNNAFHNLFQNAFFKEYIFKVRAKMDKFDETMKTSYQILQAYPIDSTRDSYELLQVIAQYG